MMPQIADLTTRPSAPWVGRRLGALLSGPAGASSETSIGFAMHSRNTDHAAISTIQRNWPEQTDAA